MLNLFKKEKGTGALIDTRLPSEKEKDYHLNELVVSYAPVNWAEKKSWNTYPIFDQNGSGSCVAQTVAKMLGIMFKEQHGDYLHFSATDVYQRRSNKPQGGMIGTEAGKIATEGVTLEALAPSQVMTDVQMDSFEVKDYMREVGNVFKVNNYVQLATQDIDAIASTIQVTGKPVMVWYYFNHDEWTDIPKVKRTLEKYASSTSRHSVTAVDFLLKDGKKYLVIDDSWGTKYGQKGQRLISEDFHNTRNFFAMYFTNFTFGKDKKQAKIVIPSNKSLKFGMKSDTIVLLQDKLKGLGFFPNNVSSTGYYGAVTKKAVEDYQTSRGLKADGVAGKNTINKLNNE